MAVNTQERPSFLGMLGEIPMLSSTWDSAYHCYHSVKDMNSLTRLTLEAAECSVVTAAKLSTPIVSKCQPQMEMLDIYACSKMNQLEEKYPIIKLSSHEAKDACVKYVQPVLGPVKPAATIIIDAINGGQKRIDDFRKMGKKLATSDIKEIFQGTLTFAMKLPATKIVTGTVDGALTYTDALVDRFIPDLADTTSSVSTQSDNHDQTNDQKEQMEQNEPQVEQMERMEQMEQMPASPQRVVVHFHSLSRKVRQRLFQRAMRNFTGAKTRTLEALGSLHGVIDLIDYAKNNLGSAKEKTEAMWSKMASSQDIPEDSKPHAENLEERIVQLGQLLTRNVTSGVSAIKSSFQGARQTITEPITSSQEYKRLVSTFNSLENLKSLSPVTLAEVRSQLTSLQVKVSHMMMEQSMIGGLVTVDMEDLCIEEDDISIPRVEPLIQGRRDQSCLQQHDETRQDRQTGSCLQQHTGTEQDSSDQSSL